MLRKQEGEYLKWDVSQKKRPEERTELERLQAENDYLRAENVILKKLRELRLKEKKEKEEKTEIVQELMTEFSLDILLKAIKLARSTYYYPLETTRQTR